MKINKKPKIHSSLNSFRINRKIQENKSNNILKLTKSLLLKKSLYNNNIPNYINLKINKSILENIEKIIPLSHRQIGNNNDNLFANSKNYIEVTTNNTIINNNSCSIIKYNNITNKKFNLRDNRFYHLKNKNIKLIKTIKNNSIKNQKDIFIKIKKRILDYKKNKKAYSFKERSKSCNNFNNNFDSLFIDFFYKWNNNNINNKCIRTIMNQKYSDLIYSENEIFNYDYSDFICNKIKIFKKEKIQNLQDNLQISFNDANNKEIKLKINSIKLTFIPQNKTNKKIILYLPFTYSLLFYYKGIDFFSKVLLSIIKFNTINYDEINSFINYLSFENEKSNNINDEKPYKRIFNKKIIRKKDKSNSHKKSGEFYWEKQDNKEYIPIFLKEKENIFTNVKFKDSIKENYLNTKKNIIMQSNTNKIENIFYNIYSFIWKTPEISYKLILEMPKIIFKYQDISKNIVTFCSRNLFLFLIKNNFINWDFYIMNYLLSIKSFRKQIMNFFSYSKINENNRFTQKENNKEENNLAKEQKEKYIVAIIANLRENSIYEFIKLDNINNIYLDENIIKNLSQNFKENDEIFYFFYTNNSNINSLISFQSYKISINYDKLNINNTWEFFLNFKQMKFLNEIKKYESLVTFLPKIVKTNFENGNLTLDFTVFDDFDPQILNYVKKEAIIPYKIENKLMNFRKSFRKKKDDMILKIQNPFIKIEKYSQSNIIKHDIDLNDEFLKNINKQNMKNWANIIIGFIEEQDLIENINYSPVIQKDNLKNRTKRKSITVKVEKSKQKISLNKYLEQPQK